MRKHGAGGTLTDWRSPKTEVGRFLRAMKGVARRRRLAVSTYKPILGFRPEKTEVTA